MAPVTANELRELASIMTKVLQKKVHMRYEYDYGNLSKEIDGYKGTGRYRIVVEIDGYVVDSTTWRMVT